MKIIQASSNCTSEESLNDSCKDRAWIRIKAQNFASAYDIDMPNDLDKITSDF